MKIKRYALTALFIALGALVVVAASGCVGTKTRTEVLMPAIQQAWVGMQADVPEGDVRTQFAQAVAQGDTYTLGLLWPSVQQLALDGIQRRVDAGSVSTGVAASLIERVNVMDEALNTLKRRPPD